jgi:hypothetical protein
MLHVYNIHARVWQLVLHAKDFNHSLHASLPTLILTRVVTKKL